MGRHNCGGGDGGTCGGGSGEGGGRGGGARGGGGEGAARISGGKVTTRNGRLVSTISMISTSDASHPILRHRESARVAVKPVSVTEEAMRLDCLSTSLSLSLSLFAVTSTVTAVPM